MYKRILVALFACLPVAFVSIVSFGMFVGNVSAATDVNWLDGANTKKWEQTTAFLATCMNEKWPNDEDLFDVTSDTNRPEDYLNDPDLVVILSDYSKTGDKEIKCKDLVGTASEILFGSSDGMFNALYAQQGDGTYRLKDDYIRKDVNDNDDDNQMAIKPFINTKYIDSGMATDPDSDTFSFDYRTGNAHFILKDHFAKCFKETPEGSANVLFSTEDIDGDGRTYFAYIDNNSKDVKLNVGTYTEDRYDGTAGQGPGDDGEWSCLEFKGKIESNDVLRWASYTTEDVRGFAEDREAAELRQSQIENITEILRRPTSIDAINFCVDGGASVPEWFKLLNIETMSELVAEEMVNQTGTIQWALGETPLEVDAVTTTAIKDCLRTAIPEIQEELDRNPDTSGYDPADPADPANADKDKTCESENVDGLDWLLCGMIGGIDQVVTGGTDGSGGLAGAVDDLLNIDADYYENDKLEKAWSYFRNIASLALVLIALIMVVGQALSKE